MKTVVSPVPEQDAAAMEATRLDPNRFNHTKLFGPHSTWEFARWNRVDAVGFIACLGVSGAILCAFWLLLRAASG
jgi:hypothetical protein